MKVLEDVKKITPIKQVLMQWEKNGYLQHKI